MAIEHVKAVRAIWIHNAGSPAGDYLHTDLYCEMMDGFWFVVQFGRGQPHVKSFGSESMASPDMLEEKGFLRLL